MIVASGRRSNGWTSGPLPRRRPIVLAGHRSDAEIAATLRHEIGHLYLTDQYDELLPDQELAATRDRLRGALSMDGRAVADRAVRELHTANELGANVLMIAWGAMPS
jgi:hypothetical protein